MKHGVWLHCDESTDTAGLVDRGAAAAEAGWDGVFVSDQLEMGAFPDPWVALAGIAERTEDVALGTWVVPVPRHDARELANAVASLDRLSGGRVIELQGGNPPLQRWEEVRTLCEPRHRHRQTDFPAFLNHHAYMMYGEAAHCSRQTRRGQRRCRASP